MEGRGRGSAHNLDQQLNDLPRAKMSSLTIQDMDCESSSSSSSREKVIRARGSFRFTELNTIPANVPKESLRANPSSNTVDVLSSFIRVKQIPDRFIYSYRVDFEPHLESVTLKRRLFRQATKDILGEDLVYDGASDARTSTLTHHEVTDLNVEHPEDPNISYRIALKQTGQVAPGSFEMLRVYNMNMRKCLEALGFFQVNKSGSYVHPALATPIGSSNSIVACRGYQTSANMHDSGDIMMKLEACHKLIQSNNVLQNMMEMRRLAGDPRENLRASLIGKLVVTNYNKVVYKVEDINFNLTPKHGFKDKKTGKDISFIEYFKVRYNVTIQDNNQPLLLVVQNNKRSQVEEQNETKEIYVVPELCNIAGLTDAQRNDNKLKIDLIRSSQISPIDRVAHMETLLSKLHNNPKVQQILSRWGYSYDSKPVEIRARTIPIEAIGVGKIAKSDRKNWPKADASTGSFEQKVMRESVAEAPDLPRLAIVLPRMNCDNRNSVLLRLKQGLQKIGLTTSAPPRIIDLPGDSSNDYITAIRTIPDSVTIIILVLQAQNKERYDSIKKYASVERGLVTQVVTAKLLLDERKANGAAVKIGIQITAKIGGEPWFVDIPIKGDMICGYDTYHDTANRGRSYGAFVASMNHRYSRWFSKADCHDKLDELSSHLAQNLVICVKKFKELNNKQTPKRIIIYRDGVSDGQLEHVYNIELKQVRRALDECEQGIKLTFIVVNKQVGARFYMRSGGSYANPGPGTVIDHTVTRKERYDFYLISQSTRHGTVAPTYYNIIYDESGLDASKQQMLAFKLCFLYYNWTGTVRVPAPCQYAHKLAVLCGDHLHGIPHNNLDDLLHFL